MISDDSKTFCQNCSQYIETSKYFLHERMCSLNVKKCEKCGKPLNIDDIDEHMKSEHSYTICDLCGLKFINNEIEKHKINCDYRLVPCKFCELNVIFIELEEHENTCGSTTQKCEKCGILIEKKNFKNHICQKKESEYLSEQIKIDKLEEDKKEKKKIKKKNNKKNKKQNNIENENEFNFNYNVEDVNMNMIFSSHELQNQIKAFNKFEEKKNKENNNKKEEDKKEKKKNKKKKEQEKEKEEEKLEEIKLNNKKKKGKKNKVNQSNKSKMAEDFSEEDDYFPSQKKINLHNIKFDLPPEEYQNYNKNTYNYKCNDFILEENMLIEAMKQSLLDQ